MNGDQSHPGRLREAPDERFAGDEHIFDLAREAARLRGEQHPVKHGHRQIVLFREDPVSLVLFDFEAGGMLPGHVADGVVTIHTISGSVEVRAGDTTHVVPSGSVLVLRPGVSHDLAAAVASRVLVTVHLMATSTP